MVILIKLFYAAAIACLVVLLLAFGVRTIYSPPDEPSFPPFPARPPITEDGQPDYTEYDEAQQRYMMEFEAYLDRRAEYRRNVLVAVAALGIASLAAGVALPARFDAIRLGLVLGGFATLLYGVIQAGDDLDRAGPTGLFLVALIGLALILYTGYRWLNKLEENPRPTSG